jgi:hypothetical protein
LPAAYNHALTYQQSDPITPSFSISAEDYLQAETRAEPKFRH